MSACIDPLWEKYGLDQSIYKFLEYVSFFLPEEKEKYYDMVYFCHYFVASYLEDNPEIAAKFRQPGYMYYDILKLASPEWSEKVNNWVLEYDIRHRGYMMMLDRWDREAIKRSKEYSEWFEKRMIEKEGLDWRKKHVESIK